MFPDRRSMIKKADRFSIFLVVASLTYLLIAQIVVGQFGHGLDSRVPFGSLLIAFLFVSIADVVVLVYTQTSKRIARSLGKWGPLMQLFQIFAIGSILSEILTIFGLLLTFFSGTIEYVLAFSIATWVLLIWVRMRLKSNLKKIPEDVPDKSLNHDNGL